MAIAYFAHSTKDGDRSRWEPLSHHLRNVSDTAHRCAEKFGAGELGALLGLLHDLGKYDDNFLRRLSGEPINHDHSTAGACIAADRYGRSGKLLAYAIAGHHAGLANGIRDEAQEQSRSSLAERLYRGRDQARAALATAIADGLALPADVPVPPLKGVARALAGFQQTFFARMLFSCLVDADFLETERFYVEAGEIAIERAMPTPLPELRAALDAYLSREILPKADFSPVNRIRANILAHARGRADQPPGVFTLTVPTGGGKTLTSLAFALDHAERHRLDRVIYVAPFTSIIEQTADVFRSALGKHAEAVLEHHSAFDETKLKKREGRDKLRLAMENWHAPIVVTTAVQFFESLFADRPSRCRKLHNMSRSVIVLDEVQTLPLGLLRPCVAALDELARNYGSTIVLCTATQPALKNTGEPDRTFKGGFADQTTQELAPDPGALFDKLKRVTIEHAGVLSDVDLAERLVGAEQVLCVVNTRAHARDLYECIKGQPGSRHLSTLMCGAHRREVLADIRADLKAGRPCRVISTTLIEAGIDVDFPLVYRAEAGLDSIAQAAGRCNREGKRDWRESRVVVFDVDDKARVLKTLRMNADLGRRLVQTFQTETLAPEAIERYFRELYWRKGDRAFSGDDGLDRPAIIEACQKGAREIDLPFERIAYDFRMIDDVFVPVIVPFLPRERPAEPVHRLIETLRRLGGMRKAMPVGDLARRLQPYTVSVPATVRDLLINTGAAEVIVEERFERQFVWVANEELYRPATGLNSTDPAFRTAESLMV